MGTRAAAAMSYYTHGLTPGGRRYQIEYDPLGAQYILLLDETEWAGSHDDPDELIRIAQSLTTKAPTAAHDKGELTMLEVNDGNNAVGSPPETYRDGGASGEAAHRSCSTSGQWVALPNAPALGTGSARAAEQPGVADGAVNLGWVAEFHERKAIECAGWGSVVSSRSKWNVVNRLGTG